MEFHTRCMWNFTHLLTRVEKNLGAMYIYFSSVHREGKEMSQKSLNPGGVKVHGKIHFFSKQKTISRKGRTQALTGSAQEKRRNKTWFTAGGELIPSTELTLADVVILVKAFSTVLQAQALAQCQREGTGGAVSGQRSLAHGTRSVTS